MFRLRALPYFFPSFIYYLFHIWQCVQYLLSSHSSDRTFSVTLPDPWIHGCCELSWVPNSSEMSSRKELVPKHMETKERLFGSHSHFKRAANPVEPATAIQSVERREKKYIWRDYELNRKLYVRKWSKSYGTFRRRTKMNHEKRQKDWWSPEFM